MATSHSQTRGSGNPRHQAPSPGPHSREDAIAGKTLQQWKQQINEWIIGEINKETITFAEGTGKILKNDGLTTSQIRNVFGEMRKIQMNGFEKEKTNFLLLRAKLAYATKRQSAKGLDKFYELYCIAYDAVDINSKDASKQYENFLKIMEAVLAYHKFYGGQ